MALLELKNIVKDFPVRRGFFGGAKEFVHAVSGVSLKIEKGETLGLVGESGCGKSTLGRIAMRLLAPTSGEIIFDGCDITGLSRKEMLPFRRRMQIVFQDPFSSLNPRMSVGALIAEPLLVNNIGNSSDREKKVADILAAVGLEKETRHRYPHEFSGGQRQRICIARALALNPELIVADEPVSSLDVAVQADILELLKKLRREHGIAYLFISHDLRIVASLCDRVCVMHDGKIVEELAAAKIKDATHPYTKTLLASVPIADPSRRKKPITYR